MTHLAAAVARELADGGIRQAFGVVGGGNIMTVACLTDRGVQYVAARHEGGAMAMADAFHRATGEVAVCTTTHGAGLTNAGTALAEAVKHRSGVLVVCGDAPAAGRRVVDIDQVAFAESLGAKVFRVTSADAAGPTAALALRSAKFGEGPAVLCLPGDLLLAEAPSEPAATGGEPWQVVPAKLPGELTAVLDLLAAARRPLILGGLGAWRSGASKVLHDLAERTGALVATTAMANGLFAGNRWSLGICGGFSSPVAAELIGEADLVLAFGASLDTFTLHGGRLLDPATTVVRVDPSPRADVPRVDLDVRADAAAAAAALLDGVEAIGLTPAGWRGEAEDRLARVSWADVPHTDVSTADRIDPRTLTIALAEHLPPERTLVLDGGQNIAWPSMYWQVPDPAAMVFMGSAFQAIGLGLAGAVGAAAGRTDRTTIAVLGDGGGLMGLPELETLIRTARSALVVVYDDAAYGFEVHMYGAKTGGWRRGKGAPRGADPATTTFADTDFAGIARSLGAQVAVVRRAADLTALHEWSAAGRRGTLVLDCKVVAAVIAPFLADLIADGH
jgi:thiamine pyrophosphate-dependent acetolactate synthase large subunit-like protein